MSTVVTGTIHGDTIKLDRVAGLADGQRVTVAVEPLAERQHVPGDGIRASAGAWADDPEDLETMFEFFRSLRQNDRPPIEP